VVVRYQMLPSCGFSGSWVKSNGPNGVYEPAVGMVCPLYESCDEDEGVCCCGGSGEGG